MDTLLIVAMIAVGASSAVAMMIALSPETSAVRNAATASFNGQRKRS